MRQCLLAIATAGIVALGFNADRAEAAPLGAAGALGTATADLNRAEPVQYAGGRCWRNAGWHGAGWYPCWRPGVVVGGAGTWHWHNHYAWHNSWHSNWHDHYSYHWHNRSGGNRHAGARRGGARHAHASTHHGGRHGGGHRGGGHHGGGHHGGGHHGGGHRR